MHKRLFLHFGAASLGSTLAGCLATAPSAGGEAPAPDTSSTGSDRAATGSGATDWQAMSTPASGIPSWQAQQTARQAFERAASGPQGSAAADLPAQALQPVVAAKAAMEQSLADFVRRWPSIAPARRQAAMARHVTPSIVEVVREMVFVADRQTRPQGAPAGTMRASAPATRTTATGRNGAPAQATAASDVVVQPGSRVRFNIKGYCLDAGLPAPVQGDQAYLAPVASRVIAPALAPLYEGAASWAARASNNNGLYPLAQQLYWALAHAGTNNHWARSPSPDVRRAMDEITPGGYRIFENYHTTELAKREVLKTVLKQTGLDRKIGTAGVEQITRGDYAGAVTRALEQQIAAGSRMPSQKGQGYSWLAPGVAARTTGSGPLAMDVEILNTSEQPFRFVPANFIVQPADKKQPVALPARLTGITATALQGASPMAALDRMFAGLEDRLSTFFTQPLFAGAFDWMRNPSPLVTASSGSARNWLQDLDSRYPLKTTLGVVPFLGNALALYEAALGKDWLYGNELPLQDRALALGAAIPSQNATLRGLEYLERKGVIDAIGKLVGSPERVQLEFVKLYNAVDGPVYSTVVMPARGYFRAGWGENNTNDSANNGAGARPSLGANVSVALLDENVNNFKIFADASLGLSEPVTQMLREQSRNWATIVGLK